jgi:ferredoxin-thioredoxin reductase catalytic subunit/glutaredoxin
MSKEIPYKHQLGENKKYRSLKLHVLSTCGHCSQTLKFLREHSVDFDYVYVDLLDLETLRYVRDGLREKFNQKRIQYPFLVIDEDRFLAGFDEEKYREFFDISITPEPEEFEKKEILVEEEKIQAKTISVLKGKKGVEDAKLFTEMVAKHQEWELTRDEKLLQILREGFATNWNRYGYFSCPCRLADGEREVDKDIICPCAYAKPDIDEYGHCYCGLYLAKEFFTSGKQPTSIPERRLE